MSDGRDWGKGWGWFGLGWVGVGWGGDGVGVGFEAVATRAETAALTTTIGAASAAL